MGSPIGQHTLGRAVVTARRFVAHVGSALLDARVWQAGLIVTSARVVRCHAAHR
jgi:hypothetical protein